MGTQNNDTAKTTETLDAQSSEKVMRLIADWKALQEAGIQEPIEALRLLVEDSRNHPMTVW